jgi:ABC-2 type transport system permease protein
MEAYVRRWKDTAVMAKRCLLCSRRNPDTLLTSIMLPALMMILFVSLFGSLIHIEGVSYVNYIVPGVLLQCIGQCSSVTAVMINKDMTSGIVNRFCTLPIKQSSILNGHILEAFLRSGLTSFVVLLVALLLGVRPSLEIFDLGVLFLLLSVSILAFSYGAAIVGITANSAEGASACSALMVILPYLSSGFAPAETLPPVMRVFAEYQPMTPVIDTMRNALAGKPLEVSGFIVSLLWCVGLSAVFYMISAALFKRKKEGKKC